MDIHRIPTHPVRNPSYRNDAATPRSPRTTSRSNSQASDDAVHPRGAMTIPGARFDDAPPPLPPPRFNQELAHGIDVAWSWGNSNPFDYNKKHLAPIQPGSSLYGSYREAYRPSISLRRPDDMDLDDEEDHRRGSTVSTLRSPSPAESKLGGHIPSLIRKPPSPTTLNQRLHGEMPLAQQNFNRSSQAYDQRVLSKIGKSNSPPRHQRSSSTESTTYAHKLSLQIKDSQGSLPSTNELPAASLDPVTRWISSPVSAGLSPGARPGWRDYGMGHRSPSMDSAATSLVLDPELFVQPRASALTSSVGSLLGTDDGASFVSQSHRGSYDQGIFAESEADLGTDEPEDHAFRNLNLGDSQQQVGRRPSKQGMKRRARSPPDASRDDKSPSRGTPTELFQKLSAGSYSHSPIARYQPKHGSVSSTSSSVRQNSYASSLALSIAGSSMTSVSSFDRLSPLDPSQPPYITSAIPVSSPATSIAPSRNLPTQLPLDAHSLLRKMPLQTALNESRLPPATRIGNYFMCDCCPKKPKKFDTEEELRAHQMEKQYTCQYCNNRFKNKNEAERHQNSLHLRRHSWSCAAIANYEAAFHPTSPPTSQTDSCGYCGEEFPNYPQPDWGRRIEHLTNVHKFGECNQAKKFFRADHFRQHLKHSHAGQSGKWTNMLETVCLREEFPQDSAGVSPTGSDSSPGRGPSSHLDPPMGGATINEVHDET